MAGASPAVSANGRCGCELVGRAREKLQGGRSQLVYRFGHSCMCVQARLPRSWPAAAARVAVAAGWACSL